MGTLAQKLEYLAGTKAAIKTAIESTGATVPAGTTFRGYASIISNLSGGGGELEAALEAAEEACLDSDIDMMLLENENYIGFGFLYSGFGIESYNSETSEFTASNWIIVSYNKTTGEWNTNDWSSSTSAGGNFINNIKYCNVVLTYSGTQLWPEVSTVAVGPNVLRTVTAEAVSALSAGEGVSITSGDMSLATASDLLDIYVNGSARSVTFNRDGTLCVIGHSEAPYLTVLDTTTNPWTTRNVLPEALDGLVISATFTSDGTLCVIVGNFSNGIRAYDTRSTPWSIVSSPSLNSPKSVAINYDGNRCVIISTSSGTGRLDVYDITDVNHEWIAVASASVSNPNSVNISPDGRLCVVATSASSQVLIYDINNIGVDTVMNPTQSLSGPSGAGMLSVAFSRNGRLCAVTCTQSPYMLAYDTTTSPWTLLDDPTELPSNTGNGTAFNHDGTLCAIAHAWGPYLTVYNTTTSPWTKLNNTPQIVTYEGKGVAFNPTGRKLVVVSAYSSNDIILGGYNVSYGTPLATASNITTSVASAYGYAAEDIAAGETGEVNILFN